jgi:hypothetical protein
LIKQQAIYSAEESPVEAAEPVLAAELSLALVAGADSMGAAMPAELSVVVVAGAEDSVVALLSAGAVVLSSFLAQAAARAMTPATRTIRARGLILAISSMSLTLLL